MKAAPDRSETAPARTDDTGGERPPTLEDYADSLTVAARIEGEHTAALADPDGAAKRAILEAAYTLDVFSAVRVAADVHLSHAAEARHDAAVTNVVRLVLITGLVSVVGCTGSATPSPVSSGIVGSQSPTPATLSGTFVGVGGLQTGPIPLRGCVSVRSATSQAPPACIVRVDADGNWSVTVTPGSYDVFGDPKGKLNGEYDCSPDHNPIPVGAGEQVTVVVVCNLP